MEERRTQAISRRPHSVALSYDDGRRTLRDHHLKEPDDVDVLERLKKLDLPHCRHWEAFLLALHSDPFECNKAARFVVARFVDLAVRTFANLGYLFVGLVRGGGRIASMTIRRGDRFRAGRRRWSRQRGRRG